MFNVYDDYTVDQGDKTAGIVDTHAVKNRRRPVGGHPAAPLPERHKHGPTRPSATVPVPRSAARSAGRWLRTPLAV